VRPLLGLPCHLAVCGAAHHYALLPVPGVKKAVDGEALLCAKAQNVRSIGQRLAAMPAALCLLPQPRMSNTKATSASLM